MVAQTRRYLARVGLERRHRYALRPTRTTMLGLDQPRKHTQSTHSL